MKLRFLTLITISVVMLSSPACKKDDNNNPTPTEQPTVAQFLFSGNNIPAPATVTFTNASVNASSYIWNFGDNSTSVEVNPQHVFATAGTYTVTLTANGTAGSNTISKTVTIPATPTKVRITKVTLSAFPLVASGGAGWDAADGPDVFFKIRDQNNNIFVDLTASRVNNVTSGSLPLIFTLSTPYEITDFNSARYIELFDYDVPPDANDNMGFIGFMMNQYTSGSNPYPSTVTITQNLITAKLDLVWL